MDIWMDTAPLLLKHFFPLANKEPPPQQSAPNRGVIFSLSNSIPQSDHAVIGFR